MALCASAANATTISVQVFDYTSFGDYTQGAVIETFENITADASAFEGGGINTGSGLTGELVAGGSLLTSVGSFTTVGGTGTGSSCRRLSVGNNTCENIALQYDPDVNGQGNIVPVDGEWSLNSADTLGIIWNVALGGTRFDQVVFALQDAADVGATITISANGVSQVLSGLRNNNRQLFVVNFGTAVSGATIRIANSRVNDGFTMDGAAISPVPLPAGVLLLLTGLGGLALARRRSA
jgi:hypothetical protein